MKKIYLFRIISGVVLLTFLITSCHKDTRVTPTTSANTRSFSSVQLQNYFSMMCTISKGTGGFFPPQVARAYGYVGIAAYESVVHGIPGAMSLYGQVNWLTKLPQPDATLQYNWAISSNTAVAEMMKNMFLASKISATNSNAIDSTENANLTTLSAGVSQDVVTRSVQFGKDVTAAIYQASLTDGGNQSYIDPFQLPYTPPTDASNWIPTSATTTPISPYWGNNRPFIAANVGAVVPVAPTAFSTDPSSDFYKAAMVVYNQVKNNTADQVAITKFWADDPFNTCTPAGHTFNIMIQLLKENNATLEKASVAFAKLSIAENDAFISCWKGKYQYNMIRPVSYIKKYIDPTFATVIGTPAFPAYTGGHSYESGAGSMIFINMFTDGSGSYSFTDYSQLQYGFAARTYTNFNDIANECANSRLYGGIHYDADNQEGLRLGRLVGDNVNKMIAWPINTK